MAPAATSAPSRTMNTNWRPVAMIRPSRRRIPTPIVITPRAAAMKPRVTPPKPSAPFTAAPSSLRGVHRRRAVLGAVLDHDPVGVEGGDGGGVALLEVALAHDRRPVLEQLGRVAAVEHPGLRRAVGHHERDAVRAPLDTAGEDGARQAEPAGVG